MTLVEGLVAILIASAVTVLITPPMFLSVATRIQNQRAEQAIQLAHGQIDQIRVLMEEGVEKIDDLPASAGTANLRDVPAPSGIFNLTRSTNFECSEYDNAGAPQVPATEALPVDVNGDCDPDFFLQSFRVNDQLSTVNPDSDEEAVPIVFGMGVRVYYRNAEIGEGDVSVEPASLKLTTGQGQQTRFPLAVIYTSLAQGDLESSREKYCLFLRGQECR